MMEPPTNLGTRKIDDAFVESLLKDRKAREERRAARFSLTGRAWQRIVACLVDDDRVTRSFRWWALAGLVFGLVYGVAAGLVLEGVSPFEGLAAMIVWYLPVSLWVGTHVHMVRDATGTPYDRFLVPNGITFLRLALAPVILVPLGLETPGSTGTWLFGLAIALVALTDLFDGPMARRAGTTSHLGAVIDPVADITLVVGLTAALTWRGITPGWLLVLVVLRYIGALVGVVVLFMLKGQRAIKASPIGKATTIVVEVVLTATAVLALVAPWWLDRSWLGLASYFVAPFLAANLGYMGWRAWRWRPVGTR